MENNTANRVGKYQTGTEGALKAALLRLLADKRLADVTVSELAREAHVSRSTFYEHYRNPADVYDDLTREFSDSVSPMMQQLACADSPSPKGKPFCEQIRDRSLFGPLVDDDRFLNTFLAQGDRLERHDLYGILRNAGYSDLQSRSLCAFQLSGCFSAARTTVATDEEWQGVRKMLDRFMLGGISACLAAKQRPASRHAD